MHRRSSPAHVNHRQEAKMIDLDNTHSLTRRRIIAKESTAYQPAMPIDRTRFDG
jgi:hypothetical protein